MASKIIQANINHSARAQDLLIQTIAEWGIKIAIVAEPYVVPARNDWVGDRDGTVAVIASGVTLQTIVRSKGCVLVTADCITIIGVYCSPNCNLADFERQLVEIGALVHQASPGPVLVAGDFNAKSVMWGSPASDARGEALQDWAAALDLVTLNTGNTNTCVRRNGGSIVDITFASPCLMHRIGEWRVLSDVETLSDHRYIRFDIFTTVHNSSTNIRSTGDGIPRWNINCLQEEIAKEAAVSEAWIARPDAIEDVNVEAEQLCASLTRVCDAAMPRAKPFSPRRRVYWWCPEHRVLRKACVAARRRYTRYRRKRYRDQQIEDSIYEDYRSACRALETAIAQAKEDQWIEWLNSLNRDPWGRPYRAVRQKLRPWAPPLTTTLPPNTLRQVVDTLFPHRATWVPPPMAVTSTSLSAGVSVPPVTDRELETAVGKLRGKKTAPGLDGVPGRVLVLTFSDLKPRLETLFSECFRQGRFPQKWKEGKLVLIRKEGRPVEQPSAYRPIVLLDELSKLLERVIAARLVQSLNPELHEAQFGFRKGRSTIGAIDRVKGLADAAVSNGGVLWAVSLDISNAFNTLPWETVKEALKYHSVPGYLQSIVTDYFTDRVVRYPIKSGWGFRKMSCGVAQGSVLGPLLWNVGYDWALRGVMLPGVSVTCYADDTLVTAHGDSHRAASRLITAGVAQLVTRIRALGLEVALNKSEALAFHGPRNTPPQGATVIVGGTSIAVKSTMKYLGLVLDGRWNFCEHFRRLAPKLVAAAGALGSILPNIEGPGAACRRLYTGVVRSMAMYGAPIWVNALSARNVPYLRRPQRVVSLRAARAYRTVSHTGACLLAGSPPWELEAVALAVVYRRRAEDMMAGNNPLPSEIAAWRQEGLDWVIGAWSSHLENPSASRELVMAIRPVLREWIERKHGTMTFYLAQMLTGHGCFGKYLCQVARRETTTDCHHCDSGAVDTAHHTFVECTAWEVPRRELSSIVDTDLSLSSIVLAIISSDEKWEALNIFCATVLKQKEAAERERETEPSSELIRRRRGGRRRRDYISRMPP